MTADKCPYSGLRILSCKVSDICDCFEFPAHDAEAIRILAARDRADQPAPTHQEEANA